MAVRRSCFKLAVALLCLHRAAPVPLFGGFHSNRYYQPSEQNRRFVSNNENDESNFRSYGSAEAPPVVNREYARAGANVHVGVTENFQHDRAPFWNPRPKHLNSNNYIGESSFQQPHVDLARQRADTHISLNSHETFGNLQNYAPAHVNAENILNPADHRDYARTVVKVHGGATENFQQERSPFWNPQPKHVNSNNYVGESSYQQPHVDLANQRTEAHISLNNQETFGNLQNHPHRNLDNFEDKEQFFNNLKPKQHQYYNPNVVTSIHTNNLAHYPVNKATVVNEDYTSPSTYNTEEIIRRNYPVPENFETRQIVRIHENFQPPIVPEYHRQPFQDHQTSVVEHDFQWKPHVKVAPAEPISVPNYKHPFIYRYKLIYPNGTIIYTNHTNLIPRRVPIPDVRPKPAPPAPKPAPPAPIPAPPAPIWVPQAPKPTHPVPHPNNPPTHYPNPTTVIIVNTTSPHHVPNPTNLNKTILHGQSETHKRHHKSHHKTVIRHIKTYPNGTTVEEVITTVVDNGVPTITTIHIVTDKNKKPVVVLNTTHVEKPERPKTDGSPDSQHTIVVHTFIHPNGTEVDEVIDTTIEGNKPPKVKRSRTIHKTHHYKSRGPLDKKLREIDLLIGLEDLKKPANETKPSKDLPKNDTKPEDPKTPSNNTNPLNNGTVPNDPKTQTNVTNPVTPKNETKPDDPKTPGNKTELPKNDTYPNNPKTPGNETKPTNGSPKNDTKPDEPKKPGSKNGTAPNDPKKPVNETKPTDPKTPANNTDPPKNETAPNDPKKPVNETKPTDPKTPANKTDPLKNSTNPSDPKTPANETKPANDPPKNETKPDDPKKIENKTSPSPDPNKNDTKPDDPKKPVNETKPPSNPPKNDTKPEKPPVKHHRLVIETHHIIHITRNRTLTDNITRTEKIDDNEPVTTKDTYSGDDDEDISDLQEGTDTDVTHGTVTSPSGTKSTITSTVTRTVKKLPDGNVAEHVTLKDDIQDQ